MTTQTNNNNIDVGQSLSEQIDEQTPTIVQDEVLDVVNTGNAPDGDQDGGFYQSDGKRKKIVEKIVNWVLIVAIVLLVCANLLRIFVVSEVTIQQNSMQPTFDPNDKVLVNKVRTPQTSDVVVVYKNDVDKLAGYFAPAKDKGVNGKYELLIKRAVAVAGDTVYVEPVSTASGVRYALNVTKNGTTYKEFYVWDSDPKVDEYGKCADCAAGKYVLATDISEARTYGKYVLQITMSANTLGILAEYTADNKYTLTEGQLLCLGDNRDRSNDSRQMGFSNTGRLLGVVVRQTHDE